MSRLWGYVLRYRVRYFGGIACLLAATSLDMTVPWLFGRAVHMIEIDAGTSALVRYIVIIACVALSGAVVRTLSRFVIFNIGRDIEYDLRNDLFAHLETLPLAFYQVRRTGDLMSRLVNDVTAVRMLLGPGILSLINTPVYYLWGLTIMLSIDAQLTLAALAAYPVAFLVVKRTSRLLMERTLRVQEGLGELSSRVQENLSGIHVVKAYASEEAEIARFARANQHFQELSLRLARIRGIIGPIMNVVGGLGALVVLLYGGSKVIAREIWVSDLVTILAYLGRLAWPTMALGWMLSILQRGRAAMQRLNDIFGVVPAITSLPGAAPIPTLRGEVALADVTFRYPSRPDAPPVLADVDLAVPGGRTIAIVGRTGSGKSALLQVLPRLFDVAAGSVMLDGRDIRTLPLGWLRRQVGLVPQDPFLFSRSIRENVALGLDGEPNGRVEWAVRMAALTRDLEEFPHGLDTIIGERGVTLSGGQKQRVALARVIATAPRILVLDDALSSVDAQTEREILEQLRGFFRERTTILVAHRITTVKEADLIVVLDEGRVVETGDHETLMANGGVYADLFRQQILEVELEAI